MSKLDDRNFNTELKAILAAFEVVSLLGLMYCLLALAGLQSTPFIAAWKLAFYGGWFALSAICVYAMLHWKKWGAYGLATATLAVTLVDIWQGSATWGGACLGLLIAVLVAAYLRPHWGRFD